MGQLKKGMRHGGIRNGRAENRTRTGSRCSPQSLSPLSRCPRQLCPPGMSLPAPGRAVPGRELLRRHGNIPSLDSPLEHLPAPAFPLLPGTSQESRGHRQEPVSDTGDTHGGTAMSPGWPGRGQPRAWPLLTSGTKRFLDFPIPGRCGGRIGASGCSCPLSLSPRSPGLSPPPGWWPRPFPRPFPRHVAASGQGPVATGILPEGIQDNSSGIILPLPGISSHTQPKKIQENPLGMFIPLLFFTPSLF